MRRAVLPSEIIETRVIAVLRGFDPEQVERLSGLLVAGGVVVTEVTMDSPEATDSIGRLSERGLAVGAGTVITLDEAKAAVAAGARFLVSPHTDDQVVEWACQNAVPVIPGALTPTEIVHAWRLGATAVKVFPASVHGPGYLRAVGGPLGHIPLIPTGGITAENAREFILAGAAAVGVGGWLTGHTDARVTADRSERIAAAVTT